MREADADLGEHVHDEPRAVEAARARTTPNVGDTEVPHRDPDHAAMDGRRGDRRAFRRRRADADRRRIREPHLRLTGELQLPHPLLFLDLRDLRSDRRQQLPPLRELRLDVLSLRPPLRDDPFLLRACILQLHSVPLDRDLRRGDVADDLRILFRRRVNRLHAIHEIVDVGRAKQHSERRVLIARRVDGDEPLRKRRLRTLQVLARDAELERVLAQIALDLL